MIHTKEITQLMYRQTKMGTVLPEGSVKRGVVEQVDDAGP